MAAHRWRALSTIALLAALLGCSGGSSPDVVSTPPVVTAKAKFVYTGNQGYSSSGTQYPSLSGYSVNTSTGALTPLGGFPFTLGVNPTVVTHDPQNRFLIVGDIAAAQIHVLAINSTTGGLSEVSPSPYFPFAEPVALTVDPSGTHVYVASQQVGKIAAYSLSSAGVLTAVAGSPFSTGNTTGPYTVGGSSLFTDTAGKFLYVQDFYGVYVYAINSATGALTLMQTIAGPSFGGGIALDPSGSYIYAVGSGANSIFSFAVNASTGMLSLAKMSPMVEQSGAYTISVSPSGQFAYTIEDNNDLVSYSISNGAMTPVGTPYSGIYGQQIAVDPTSGFLYVPQACGYCPSGVYNVVHEFSLGTTGALTKLNGSPVAAGVTPWGITITTQ